jgi:hypothetical protein
MKPEFKQDYELFNMIRDKAIYQGDFELLNYHCIICGSPGHFKSQCPRETYKIDLLMLSHFWTLSWRLFQHSFNRPQRKKFRALRSLDLLLREEKKLNKEYEKSIYHFNKNQQPLLDQLALIETEQSLKPKLSKKTTAFYRKPVFHVYEAKGGKNSIR